MKVAYLVTHPIQYQSPLLRRLSVDPTITLKVFYCSDISIRKHFDEGFGRLIEWDVPLTEGISHEFLPALGGTQSINFFRPFNYGLLSRLRKEKFDVLWIHGYARWFHLWSAAGARLLGIKVFIRDEATEISAVRSGVKKIFKKILFRYLNWVCKGFLTIGTRNSDYYENNGIPATKLFLVPYAVDNDFFKRKMAETDRAVFKESINANDDLPIILCASKFTDRKRCQDLLAAFEALSTDGKTAPLAHLVFLGDGELRHSLEKRVQHLGWQHVVHFLGFKTVSEMPQCYAAADIFVLPSIREPWGLVVNEAMTAGKPLILSDQVGSAKDLLVHGENGFVFTAGDVREFAGYLRHLIENKALRSSMGLVSLERIKKWSYAEDILGLKQAFA